MIKSQPILHTKQLTLRPLNNHDVTEKYVAWLNDPSVNQYLETRFSAQNIDTCLAFVNQCNADISAHLFGVFLNTSSQHIGNCKIGFIDPIHHKAQISLFIGDKSHWSKGLGQEIVSALTQFGFNTLNLQKIEAGCYQDNLASLRIFLNSGYQLEGCLKNSVQLNDKRSDVVLLGLSKTEFQP